MKYLFRFIMIFVPILIVVFLFNSFQLKSRQLKFDSSKISLTLPDSLHINLAKAISFRTVSYSDPALFDSTQFLSFIDFVKTTYPSIHNTLKLQMVNDFAFLYMWEGKNPDLPPALLMGHYDVVPVIQGTEQYWDNPPFAGRIKDDFIYGRGAMDDKATVIGILEALEYLINNDFKPIRSYYIAFGHDEEVLGRYGAEAIAQLLKSSGVQLEYVLDEGGLIKSDGMVGLQSPIALIGVAEKGYVTLQLTATGEGGHSSMPPVQTSIGMLAEAIDRLQKTPFESRLEGAAAYMLDYLAPEMSFGRKVIMANRWLTEGMVTSAFSKSNSGNAMIRTTIAPTILDAGLKENVLPIDATAKINFRILPGDSVKDVLNHVRKAVNNDRIAIEISGQSETEPSMVSDTATAGFRLIHRIIRECFPDVLVAPYLVVGATDSRYFTSLTSNIYRFMPIKLTDEDLKRIHGTNERIHKDDFKNIVEFYVRLIMNDN